MVKFALLLFLSQCAKTSSFGLHSAVPVPVPTAKSSPRNNIVLFSTSSSSTSSSSIIDEDPIQKTKEHLEKLSGTSEFADDEEVMYKQYVSKPANTLKEELKSLKLQTRGRKPDLARRLVDHHMSKGSESESDSDPSNGSELSASGELEPTVPPQWQEDENTADVEPLRKFAKMQISTAAGTALARAGFELPTPIQATALPLLTRDKESLILHAETGSGKTLAYLLPITERLWREEENSGLLGERTDSSYALILTPTRELAAQVAGIATVLSPPNSVRLVTTPTNLLRDSWADKERSEGENGGRFDHNFGGRQGTKIIVGSSKSILLSLFGDSKLHPPTSKPEAKKFLSSTTYLVLDEVDRLFNIKTGRGKTSKFYKKHDKPAAILTSTIARTTLGQAQIVAASATVGRPLRRELARVLGLTPDECPRVVRPSGTVDDPTTRPISVPKSLKHYALPCDGTTSGSLLTAAAFATKVLPTPASGKGRKTLFVITKSCGINLRDAIGALKHFNVQPQPKELLGALSGDGTDQLMNNYRRVSGSVGLGERAANVAFDENEGYLLVTGEETVRGIHLDGLDTVVVVGRPKGPDEYIHIAGRAGRAGKAGSVINVLSYEQSNSLASWEGMLGISFEPVDESEISTIQ
uniref:ATP-dependent RNA helicase n=1 Tax=Chaetoceros debilis TaxID=122233 RepID=A0A7S3QIU8_9STRA|mmetsp:Transcript_22242/g.33906  ORF Transcript_22242/g.33906 Transcript_22242/m.33906 type:complete len:641 (-) Transcript_22242:36-1958(-)|eukprot:CAMPEP_0194076836 /NCGR_PEP_ID=MMETSP0149-20130528/3591_1 /TAXON_ID=122233 /ORGANISM="Chaetoceros debilis, Strain MM31A-1" /LENGTH=640 /DNA_ID=CAMNT_0038757707 /DNA_START=13 /DNA_END=1935 /DNA_ORIENTATION=-